MKKTLLLSIFFFQNVFYFTWTRVKSPFVANRTLEPQCSDTYVTSSGTVQGSSGKSFLVSAAEAISPPVIIKSSRSEDKSFAICSVAQKKNNLKRHFTLRSRTPSFYFYRSIHPFGLFRCELIGSDR